MKELRLAEADPSFTIYKLSLKPFGGFHVQLKGSKNVMVIQA